MITVNAVRSVKSSNKSSVIIIKFSTNPNITRMGLLVESEPSGDSAVAKRLFQ